ncbi:MAG: alpha-hydroxy-acid oxidizing protein [Desulfovibrio sp.]|jgi:NAD(P)H-dependent flavin oxidoreductase YrpB (nitropropane dioxygenase family)|nr:alpha-hydroxy-acid oxidizing protein [Desulfovibrio sp.]
MQAIHERARTLLGKACRCCPVCDGRACSGEVPGMGGLGTGAAFRANVSALADVRLNMRLIHEALSPVTAASFLGIPISLPVVAAPIGGMFNINECMQEADYISGVIEGCKAAGTLGCSGDGVPPIIMDSGLEAIRKAAGHGIPFVKPWEKSKLDQRLAAILASDCPAVGMDIDAAGLITLAKMGHPVHPKNVDELAEIAKVIHEAGKKFIVKGIMTPKDARLAVDAEVDAIVVSNHGGRVLDHTPGTAQVLPGIAKAVGKRMPVMVDGGVRTGVDVLKMLALGADIVGIGRPVTLAVVGGGREGVTHYIEKVKTELIQAMVLTGCATIEDVDDEILHSPKDGDGLL